METVSALLKVHCAKIVWPEPGEREKGWEGQMLCGSSTQNEKQLCIKKGFVSIQLSSVGTAGTRRLTASAAGLSTASRGTLLKNHLCTKQIAFCFILVNILMLLPLQ